MSSVGIMPCGHYLYDYDKIDSTAGSILVCKKCGYTIQQDKAIIEVVPRCYNHGILSSNDIIVVAGKKFCSKCIASLFNTHGIVEVKYECKKT